MKFENNESYEIEGELEGVAYGMGLVSRVNYGLHEKKLRRFFSNVGAIIP